MGEWAAQEHVVARRQLVRTGMTRAQARQQVVSGRWRMLHPGVYVTHTGPVSEIARAWAAVLWAGDRAVLGHASALWQADVLDDPPAMIHVCVPADRRVRPRPGIRIHHSRRWSETAHPAARPPRQRVEAALVDATATMTAAGSVLDTVLRATQRRITTPGRIRAELATRRAHRWRPLLHEVLTDAEAGVASPLERRYHREVERRHGLPRGLLNAPEAAPGVPGGTWYRDVRYPGLRTSVELDGQEAHPGHDAFRDRRRDNRAAELQEAALRYGWAEVAGDPCGVAAQVAWVLRRRGWTGRPRACRPGCRATHPPA